MMIVLFTDFGSADLYVGQLKAVFAKVVPGLPVIDLLHDAPACNVRAGAHLLSALVQEFPTGSVFLAVVDPGVGGSRRAVVVEADGRFFVGPDNGLLSVVAARASACRYWRIDWQPQRFSHSFHGRDLFAPVAAQVASGILPLDKLVPVERLDIWLGAEDAAEIIYLDHYGNAMTGLRVGSIAQDARLQVNGHVVEFARTFSVVPAGTPFWYENSIGLVEIAVNCGSAASQLGLGIGQLVHA